MPRPGNVRGARKAAEDADRARRASNKAPQKKHFTRSLLLLNQNKIDSLLL